MRWVYRLQQRIAITRGECNVILGLVLLFCLGLTVRYIQSRAQPLPEVVYPGGLLPQADTGASRP